jgi:hypothetical protein
VPGGIAVRVQYALADRCDTLADSVELVAADRGEPGTPNQLPLITFRPA